MAGMPWFKFFWAEFQTTERIVSCSPEARCLLILLYGFLRYNGQKRFNFEPKFCERRFNFEPRIARKCLLELQEAGLILIDSEGYVEVPEFFKSSYISEIRSECGKKGGKNITSFAPKQSVGQNPSDSVSDSVSKSISLLTEGGCRGGEIEEEFSSEIPEALPPDEEEETNQTQITLPAPPEPEDSPEKTPSRKKPRKARSEATGEKSGGEEAEVETGFLEFWSAYPRKEAKAEARKAWRQVTVNAPARERILPEEIMTALVAQKELGWFPRETKFIPHAATYLRGRRWEDVPTDPGRAPAQPAYRATFARDEPIEMEKDPTFEKFLNED